MSNVSLVVYVPTEPYVQQPAHVLRIVASWDLT